MPRRRPRSEPACPRCGNEEDLTVWLDGKTYCWPCLRCPHNDSPETGMHTVCIECLRQLYSIVTFEGWRVVDMAMYSNDAVELYRIDADAVLVWAFEESIYQYDGNYKKATAGLVLAPPPHHQLTSSHENQ
jgi:hypothetical protein